MDILSTDEELGSDDEENEMDYISNLQSKPKHISDIRRFDNAVQKIKVRFAAGYICQKVDYRIPTPTPEKW